jgi:uncharacterized protein (DUF885 family)
MTDALATYPLPRPEPDSNPGPRDDELYDLVEARFRRLIRSNPTSATQIGIHSQDDQLADGTRDALLAELAADKVHLAAVEAIEPSELSPTARLERDLEVHHLRLEIFETEVVRTWERRSSALEAFGDALFGQATRDHAPLAERLRAIAGRLEALPLNLQQHRTRAAQPQVRLWQQAELERAADLPAFLDRLVDAGRDELGPPELRRLARASASAQAAMADHADWLRGTIAGGVDTWALGRERLDELIALRALDGLGADEILALGHEQLALESEARRAAAREIDPTAPLGAVIERIRSDHPASFDEALDAYRDAMIRARQHLIDHRIVTVPDDERLSVMATPEFQRKVLPLAAYFDPPKFDPLPAGIYVVTPSVDGDPNAMREHNRAGISNASIHEAYPGHHLQMAVAIRHPSLTRLSIWAPEFHEGWAMYSEQLMREQGFDDGPAFRLQMHTDAIWRACRIILDITMHRGEIEVDEATDFLVRNTAFEQATARAEIHRYTYTPTYQLSYLLGKVLLLRLRADEQRRLGDRFDLCSFHDAILRSGSVPISFLRPILAAGNGAAAG